MKMMLVIFLLFVTHAQAQAQAQAPSRYDGVRLNQGFEASARVKAGTARAGDDMEFAFLHGFVGGLLSAEKAKVNDALILLAVVGSNKPDEKLRTMGSTALMFSPLLGVPELESDQVYAIIKNYIDKNPKRWKEAAHVLIIDALKEAYPPQVSRK